MRYKLYYCAIQYTNITQASVFAHGILRIKKKKNQRSSKQTQEKSLLYSVGKEEDARA